VSEQAERGLRALFDEVARVGNEVCLDSGAFLWKEGDPGDHVALIVDGSLDVTHEAPDGEVLVLRTVDAGAVVGEIAAFDGRSRSATVRARTPSRILRIAAPEFRALLRRRPDILENLFWLQVDRVRSLTQRVTRTHQRAITDPLTKLYNFGFFRERLEMEVERARHTEDLVSLAMFDIDHFKNYNDTHGHQEGNVVLAKVAEIIKGTGRRGDIIARYGGEEFVALLYGARREEALRFAENARRSVEAHNFAGGESQPLGRVTISGGVSTFPLDSFSDEALIEAADRNLYRAKETGRNRVLTAAHDV
jgi:diguanylate cyclase (GGDEF)-like protein